MTNGAQTLSNILRQPAVWAALAEQWPRHADLIDRAVAASKGAERIIYTGCGSAWFAAQALAATAAGLLGVPARAVPASEAALFPETMFAGRDRTALVALSRSGQTSETLEAVRVYRQWSAGPVWALTSAPTSDLARAADTMLDASVGEERGIVQTSSLSSMLLLGLAAIAYRSGQQVGSILERIPDAADEVLTAARPLAELWGDHPGIERFFFLGAGPWRGIAAESMLKVKEMSRAQSESFHTLEFRHGLGANADEHSLVVGFLSDRGGIGERAVLDEFRARQGVTTLAVGEAARASSAPREFVLPLQADLPEWARLPLALPFAQLLGLARALDRGHDPDEPVHLKSYIALDGPLG